MTRTRTINGRRRALAAGICLVPVWLVVASLIATNEIHSSTATAAAVVALLIGVCNFCLSYVGPSLHVLRGRSMDDYRFVSGVPMVGSFLVVVAVVMGFGALVPTLLAAVATLVDTAGLPWFLLASWRDHSFWDD